MRPFLSNFRRGTLDDVPRSHSQSLYALVGATDRSELNNIYHHLRGGCILGIGAVHSPDGRFMFHAVNYGPYRLGIMDSAISQRILELDGANVPYRITISRIDREKYMPPRAIEVELEWSSVAMAA